MSQTAPIGIQRVVFNPSPKSQFRESAVNIREHRALLENPAFERALQFAQLEYQRHSASLIRDGNGALAHGYKLLGVQEFLSCLKLLSEETLVSAPTPPSNLDHRA